MRTVRTVVLGLLGLALLASQASAGTAIKLQFVNHLQAKLPEQDVYIERPMGSGKVYRVTAADKDMSAPLYAAATVIKHDPFNPKALGPYGKGRSLGFTLGQWLAAKGSGTYSCDRGKGTVTARFESLVPSGVYTMWYFFLPMPPPQPFTGTLDLPLGARDGTQNTFVARADGKAFYRLSFKPCLQLSGEQVAAGLAIAWHSDGKTYASDPGPFGTVSHVQLFLLLPAANGM
jgi:hypothetical protein